MKDGRTHLAYKAEHGVDLDTGAIVSVTVQDASEGDSATLPKTLTKRLVVLARRSATTTLNHRFMQDTSTSTSGPRPLHRFVCIRAFAR